MRRLLAGLYILAVLLAAAPSSALDPNAIPIGSFARLLGTPANTVLAPAPPGSGYAPLASIMNEWSGAWWDTLRLELGVTGGGHSAGALIDAPAFTPLTAQTWRLAAPRNVSWGPQSGNTPVNPDGTPGARHTYGGLCYMPTVDRVLMLPGSLWYAGGGDNRSWWIDPATGARTQKANTLTSSGLVLGSAWDPVNQECVYAMANRIWAYSPATDNHRAISSSFYVFDIRLSTALDVANRHFYLVGKIGATPVVKRFHIDTANAPMVDVPFTGATAIVTDGWVGLDYDPDGQQLVGWKGGLDVYTAPVPDGAPPATLTWTKTTFAGDNPGAMTPAGMFGRFRYLGSGLVGLVTSIVADVYLARIASGEPLPQPPRTLEVAGQVLTVPTGEWRVCVQLRELPSEAIVSEACGGSVSTMADDPATPVVQAPTVTIE